MIYSLPIHQHIHDTDYLAAVSSMEFFKFFRTSAGLAQISDQIVKKLMQIAGLISSDMNT